MNVLLLQVQAQIMQGTRNYHVTPILSNSCDWPLKWPPLWPMKYLYLRYSNHSFKSTNKETRSQLVIWVNCNERKTSYGIEKLSGYCRIKFISVPNMAFRKFFIIYVRYVSNYFAPFCRRRKNSRKKTDLVNSLLNIRYSLRILYYLPKFIVTSPINSILIIEINLILQ